MDNGFVNNGLKSELFTRLSLASLLALLMLLSAGTGANAQTMQPAPNPGSAARPIDDITHREVVEMDQFLDGHPEVAEQLRKDPSLIDNQRWVADHPALKEYLQNHPRISQTFRTNPSLFMRDEERYERHESDRDITRRDVAEMDRFLDNHPEIAEQLRKDPSLIDNREWVANHPALQEYLQSRPSVREEFRSNPDAFMRAEERFDRREDDRDITRSDVAEMDRFLDNHPEIAEQLRKDPSLIDNHRWVSDHPALQQYLRTHSQVAEAFRAHPDAFMGDEERYDRHDDHMYARGDDRGELNSFGRFLGGHSNVAAELSNDPSLATNREYLASHPELDEYLKAHPTVTQQLAENPQAVLSSDWVKQSGGMGAKQPATPKDMPKEKPPNQ